MKFHSLSIYKLSNLGLQIGFTAILIGYLMVWLPQPASGLSFIGMEMGEWVKFLPQVESGEIVPGRTLFYLPPITLGLMLLLWTAEWPKPRWRTWLMRGVAVLVSCLVFPPIEVILNESANQWLVRMVMIGLVAAVALLIPILKRWVGQIPSIFPMVTIIVLGLVGAILPAWAYLAIRPVVSMLLRSSIGFGPGFWLNSIGHIVVVIVAMLLLWGTRKSKN